MTLKGFFGGEVGIMTEGDLYFKKALWPVGGNAGQPGPHFQDTSSEAVLFWTGDAGLPGLTGGQWAASPFASSQGHFY